MTEQKIFCRRHTQSDEVPKPDFYLRLLVLCPHPIHVPASETCRTGLVCALFVGGQTSNRVGQFRRLVTN